MDSDSPEGPTPDARDAARREQGDAAVAGVRWLTTAQLLAQVLRAGMNVVLVWFLTKGDYGRVGVAMVVLALIDRLSDLGTGQAVIQRDELDKRTTDAVFALNALIGVTLSLAILIFAEPLALLFGGEAGRSSAPLLRLLSLSVFVKSTGIVHFALLRRHLLFKKAALSVMAGSTTSVAVAIVLAVLDAGAWAIVIGSTCGSLISTLLTWGFSKYRPSPKVEFGAVKSIAGFSSNLTANNLFNYFSDNLDRMLISRNLGTEALGLYALGGRILRTPINMLTSTTNQVLIPVLSRNQNDTAEQRRRFLQASSGVALIALPSMSGLAVVAKPLVEVAFPDEWSDAASIVALMALVGMTQALVRLASAVYVANARTGTQLINAIVVGSILMVSYIITARESVEAVVIGTGLVYLLTGPFVMYVPFKILDLSYRRYVTQIAPATLVAAASAAAAYGARLAVDGAAGSALVELGAAVAAGAIVGLGAIAVFKPTGYDEMLRITGLGKARRPAPTG